MTTELRGKMALFTVAGRGIARTVALGLAWAGPGMILLACTARCDRPRARRGGGRRPPNGVLLYRHTGVAEASSSTSSPGSAVTAYPAGK